MSALSSLAHYLGTHATVAALGEDCAAITNPAGNGYLLFAAEGMTEEAITVDPWFAGYVAVMRNLSKAAGMGGRPVAVTDVLWTPAEMVSPVVADGVHTAARAYNVPIISGHSLPQTSHRPALGAAVLGQASERLITCSEIQPGDRLLIAIDMHGGYHAHQLLWNSSSPDLEYRLRSDLELLPSLAEKGLCRSGKDIGCGGIAGTLAMLCQCSEVGVELDLTDLPCPMDVEMERWLVTIPSYGFLLAVDPEDVGAAISHFTATKITCREIGRFTEGGGIKLRADGESADLVIG